MTEPKNKALVLIAKLYIETFRKAIDEEYRNVDTVRTCRRLENRLKEYKEKRATNEEKEYIDRVKEAAKLNAIPEEKINIYELTDFEIDENARALNESTLNDETEELMDRAIEGDGEALVELFGGAKGFFEMLLYHFSEDEEDKE